MRQQGDGQHDRRGHLQRDTVVVRQADTVDHNDIVAAVLDGEATVKRLRREDGHVWLMPHNPVYAHTSGSHAAILGNVVAVLRMP
ncbi:hypothetical protein Shyd_86500 [Streptomyces hydrogenans]|uniref:Peptidase S24/S26A/S26B/S26C domain-containing protein n=1 Tax=Streptomyces hydrogenans TaxID=1873719 RepID=A0ABQ3PQJ4_9ACTN|nr:hypothetical protein GCM10018784_42660 [Streptomyces hydrogenans]GHI27279.1 hypothetical protein Shyd_86500 [Streptomyces hydrogenans]